MDTLQQQQQRPQQRQFQQTHLPPSPPPSPPTARRRHKKKDSLDPFLQLGHASHPPSPPVEAEEPEEPLYRKLFVTPFLFVSFILSLFLVDTRNAISRTRNSTLFSFLDPEPYQDPHHATWDRRGSTTHVKPPDSLNPEQRKVEKRDRAESWHLHRKIRKIAKLEVSDAFEMRDRVMVAMLIAFFLVAYALGWVFVWMMKKF